MPSSRGSSEPGIEPVSPVLQADSLPLSHLRNPGSVFLGNGLYFQHGESIHLPVERTAGRLYAKNFKF